VGLLEMAKFVKYFSRASTSSRSQRVVAL
jgi:hypothetical protein